MSSEPSWITKNALLLLHKESLSKFGGPRGVLDEGFLECALAHSRDAPAHNSEATLAELALWIAQHSEVRMANGARKLE